MGGGGASTTGGVVNIDVLEVDELQVNSAIKLSKAAASTTNFGEFQVEENRMQLDPESSFNSLNFSAPNIVLDGNVSILGVASTIRQTDIQTTSIQMYDNVATIGEANTSDTDKGVHCVYYDEETTTNKHDFFGTTKNLRPTATNPIFTYLVRVNGMDKPEIKVTDADKVYSNVFYKSFQSNIIGDAEFSRVYLNTLHTNNHKFIDQDKLTLTNGTNIFEVNFGTKTVESIPEIIIYSYPTYAKLPTLTFKNTVTATPDYFDPLKSVDMNTTSGVIDFGTTTNFSRIGSGQETSTSTLGKLSILIKNNSKYKDFRFESDGFINTHKLNVDSVLISNHGMEIKGVKHRVINWTSSETTSVTTIDLRLNPTHSVVSGDSTFIMIEEFTPVKYFNNNIYKAYYKDSEHLRIHLPKTEVNIPFPLPYSVFTYSVNVYFIESKKEQNLIDGTKFNRNRILKQQHYKFTYTDTFNLLPGKLNLNNEKNEGILLENDNSCLKISTKRSSFYLTGTKKLYFDIMEKPLNYNQNNQYGSSTSSTTTTTSSSTSSVFIPQYLIDSAHTHGTTTSTEVAHVDNDIFISKTKLLLFIESNENYQRVVPTIETGDSVVTVLEEEYTTTKRPMVIFSENSDNYQKIENTVISVPEENSIVEPEESIPDRKMKLLLFSETSDNYQQIVEITNPTDVIQEQPIESEKKDIQKTKLVLFSENSDNYQQIVETQISSELIEDTSESVKSDIQKTKLVLFSENSNNYQQIIEDTIPVETIDEPVESSKKDIQKTKLVLFSENSNNYQQIIENNVSEDLIEETVDSSKKEIQKSKLVLFSETSDNYQQIVSLTSNESDTNSTILSEIKDDTKMKLLLFSENSNNYQQIIDPIIETDTEQETIETKSELSKTKLVIFSENSNNYLQIKSDIEPVIDSSELSSSISNTTINKNLIVDFKIDNSFISYDFSRNIIFNETTIKNTLNVKRLNTTSDIRLKENILPIERGLDTISNINTYSFNFKKSNRKVYGVIAQEIEEILPNLVTEIDGIKRVDYTQLTPILIKSVQELKVENTMLKNRLVSIEEKLDKILGKN